MIFYLGTHEPSWLVRCTVPLMVSRNRLARLKTLPTAATDWVMDSGGFTELQQHGRWRIDARTYATELVDLDTGSTIAWPADQPIERQVRRP